MSTKPKLWAYTKSCTQQIRFVKSGGAHNYRLCAKKKEEDKPAKCVVRDGAHPTNCKAVRCISTW